jgi:hypothetical protein
MQRVWLMMGAVLLCTACGWDLPPVDWQAPAPVAAVTDSGARFAALWQPGARPEVRVDRVDTAARGDAGEGVDVCPGSRQITPLVRGARWSTWWRIRRDSSSVLMVDQRDSAGALVRTITVDSVDQALLGCARPAPAIAADSINGYVHVSYFMVAPEGPGVFYAHLMDPRATRFEVPMAMVYGEKPVAVTVASRGDTVAVVYEDPNSDRGRIAMSLSLAGGHLFEQTARIVPVSTSSQQARQPSVVRLGGAQVWVGWTEASASGAAFLVRRASIVAR